MKSEQPFSRGLDGLSLAAVLTVSRVDVHRSRQLMRDSQALITHAREVIRQARWIIGQQTFLQIVCAWCQQTMRWERVEGASWGQISHSICYDCFAPVFGELKPGTTPPPRSTQAPAGEHPRQGLRRHEDARRTVETDTMAGRARHRAFHTLPAEPPPTPRTFDQPIALPPLRELLL